MLLKATDTANSVFKSYSIQVHRPNYRMRLPSKEDDHVYQECQKNCALIRDVLQNTPGAL